MSDDMVEHPFDREDREIREAFAEKDAEIDHLKQNVNTQHGLLNKQGEELAAKDAEIERLKVEYSEVAEEKDRLLENLEAEKNGADELRRIITQLIEEVEYLASKARGYGPWADLIQRAREAVKE